MKAGPLCRICKHYEHRHTSGRCSANYSTIDGSVYRCRCDGKSSEAHPRELVSANILRGSAARARLRREIAATVKR